ncbi:protein of unknown function [Pseudorhizobium banfieldiae]|uniref:Uncharacterized protein n=1 Tax=Pseudorhizobium banfieldiae TaxID=1125847 RepID=L0NFV3_9HYPH|nr:protein of unknown function [Pseudorhizobium banfieldiae]
MMHRPLSTAGAMYLNDETKRYAEAASVSGCVRFGHSHYGLQQLCAASSGHPSRSIWSPVLKAHQQYLSSLRLFTHATGAKSSPSSLLRVPLWR